MFNMTGVYYYTRVFITLSHLSLSVYVHDTVCQMLLRFHYGQCKDCKPKDFWDFLSGAHNQIMQIMETN